MCIIFLRMTTDETPTVNPSVATHRWLAESAVARFGSMAKNRLTTTVNNNGCSSVHSPLVQYTGRVPPKSHNNTANIVKPVKAKQKQPVTVV